MWGRIARSSARCALRFTSRGHGCGSPPSLHAASPITAASRTRCSRDLRRFKLFTEHRDSSRAAGAWRDSSRSPSSQGFGTRVPALVGDRAHAGSAALKSRGRSIAERRALVRPHRRRRRHHLFKLPRWSLDHSSRAAGAWTIQVALLEPDGFKAFAEHRPFKSRCRGLADSRVSLRLPSCRLPRSRESLVARVPPFKAFAEHRRFIRAAGSSPIPVARCSTRRRDGKGTVVRRRVAVCLTSAYGREAACGRRRRWGGVTG
jgi:hypothetical protein